MPPPSSAVFNYPLFGRGFRPFFLMAAAYSVINIISWIGIIGGLWGPPGVLADPVLWHAHEMIYGFGMAVVAGFLLTAVANWTGGAPVRQLHLAALCLVWVAGRIAMNTGLPPLMTAWIDAAFIPALAVSLSVPLFRSRNRRNFVFLGMLWILFACDAAFFALQDRLPLHVSIGVVIAMISLVGGRIIPAFTVAGLRRAGKIVFQHDQSLLDMLCLLSLAVLVGAIITFHGVENPVAGAAAAAAGFLHLARMRYYHAPKVIHEPMLWILHAGYAWLILGLFFLGLCGYGKMMLSPALHAWTAGCIGSMCIGMMSRVTLGHTGRELKASPATVLSFAAMQLAALSRVFGPLLLPEHYAVWIACSGVLWAMSFALYLLVYAPMLVRPRPDGLPA